VLLRPLYTSDKASTLGRYGENLENGIRVLYAIHGGSKHMLAVNTSGRAEAIYQ